MRSRSSTIARRWTCSCRRAFSIAIPAWTANVSTSALVGLRELGGAGLVGEIQVADRAALHGDRHAKEAVHRRVVRREPVSSRIDGDVGDAERAVLLDDQAEEPVAARQRPDRGPGLAAHPGRDEALDHAVRMDRPEGRVVRPDEQPDLVHDHLQDIVDGLQAGDRPGRGIEGVDDAGRCLCVLAAAHARHGSSARRVPNPLGRLARQCGPDGPWRGAIVIRNLCE